MNDHLSPNERWHLYRFGFKHGVAGRVKDETKAPHRDYQRGYDDGVRAYTMAAEEFRLEVGAPVPSPFRGAGV